MVLPLQKPAGGYLRLYYRGTVGVAGVGVQQNWDLTEFFPYLREHPLFKNNLLILVRGKSEGLTNVSASVGYVEVDGVPTQLVLTLDVENIADEIWLDVWLLHSVTGLVSDQAQLYFIADPSALAGGSSSLLWGAGDVSSSTTTRYLQPGYTTSLAPTTPTQFRVPADCTLQNLRVHHNTPAGNGEDIVYTLRVNGVPTALAATLASTDADGANTVAAVAALAGDLVDIEITKAASVGTSPSDVMASLEVAA